MASSVLRYLFTIAAALLVAPLLALAASSQGQRVLVVLEGSQTEYGSFFTDLETRGYQLSFRTPKLTTPELTKYEDLQFDHLIIMAPTAKTLPSDLSPQALVSFLKEGGNILFALSSHLSESYRDLAREFSLEFAERDTPVVDHFRHVPALDSTRNHTAILVGGPVDAATGLSPGSLTPNPVIFSPATLERAQSIPLLYDGVAHRFGAIPLAFPLLTPPGTSYSAVVPASGGAPLSMTDESASEAILGAEPEAALISAFQLKDNSARAVWVGSTAFFEDRFVDAKNVKGVDGTSHASTLNGEVLKDLTAWLFQERGVLRVVGTHHDRVRESADDVREEYEETGPGKMYRVKDTVTFSIDLSQHTVEGGWVPAPTNLDLQASLVMLDPYITTSMTAQSLLDSTSSGVLSTASNSTSASTRYSVTLRLPDRHGVFTFVVRWSRPGWTYVHTRDTAPVRPFNSDEHPRFLSAAHPYVAGAFSTIVGFLVFTTLWILSEGPEEAQRRKKAQ